MLARECPSWRLPVRLGRGPSSETAASGRWVRCGPQHGIWPEAILAACSSLPVRSRGCSGVHEGHAIGMFRRRPSDPPLGEAGHRRQSFSRRATDLASRFRVNRDSERIAGGRFRAECSGSDGRRCPDPRRASARRDVGISPRRRSPVRPLLPRRRRLRSDRMTRTAPRR